MFIIDDKHLLQLNNTSYNIKLEHKIQNTKFNKVFKPEILIIHYAVTDSLNALIASQIHTQFYAHFCIDGWTDGNNKNNYLVTQMIPTNIQGSHAGESVYKGRSGCNTFSTGIEISNPGPLIKQLDGSLKTTYGKKWPLEDTIEAKHKSGLAPKNWTHWAKYSDEELDLCMEIGKALKTKYDIKDVVGHDDVSPGRKSDPGPAFDMGYIHREIFGF